MMKQNILNFMKKTGALIGGIAAFSVIVPVSTFMTIYVFNKLEKMFPLK